MRHREVVRWASLSLLIGLTLSSGVLQAQNSELLLDLNVEPTEPDRFVAHQPIEFNGSTYFLRSERFSQSQLWKTDGTAGGTERIFEFPHGQFCSAAAPFAHGLFIACSFSELSAELYLSDGTKEGTLPVADIEIGAPGFVEMAWHDEDQAIVHFGVGKSIITDGTLAGTSDWHDIRPDKVWRFVGGDVVLEDFEELSRLTPEGIEADYANISWMAVTENAIFAIRRFDEALIRVDGESIVVIETNDFWDNSVNTGTSLLLQAGGRILELAGTSSVVTVFAENAATQNGLLVAAGDGYAVLTTNARDRLMIVDATGTTLGVNLAFSGAESFQGRSFVYSPDGVFEMSAAGPVKIAPATNLRAEIRESAGRFFFVEPSQFSTPKGSEFEKLLEGGLTDNGSSHPFGFMERLDGNALAFWATVDNQTLLHVTDGTAQGTQVFADIHWRASGRFFDAPLLAAEDVFFTLNTDHTQVIAIDDEGISGEWSFARIDRLSSTGGAAVVLATIAGMRALFVLRPGREPELLADGENIGVLEQIDDSVFYTSFAEDDTEWALMRLDANLEITRVAPINMFGAQRIIQTGDVYWMLGAGGRALESSTGILDDVPEMIYGASSCGRTALLIAGSGNLFELTEEGVVPLFFQDEALQRLSPSMAPQCWQDRLVVSAWTETTGSELFVVEEGELRLLADLIEGPISSGAVAVGVVQETLLFSAVDAEEGRELYAMRGDEIVRIPGRSGPQSTIIGGTSIAAIQGNVLFAGFDTAHGNELWQASLRGLFGQTSSMGSSAGCGCSQAAGATRTRHAGSAVLLVFGVLLLYARARERRTSSRTDTTSRTRG